MHLISTFEQVSEKTTYINANHFIFTIQYSLSDRTLSREENPLERTQFLGSKYCEYI